MNSDRIGEMVHAFPSVKIGVLGDFFLDHYLEVEPALAEPSVETGKVAHQVVAQRSSAGAAGTVVNNLAALGVQHLFAFGAIGDDGYGSQLECELKKIGCSTEGLVASPDIMTPVYMKPVDRGRKGLDAEHSRYDIRNRMPTPETVIARVLANTEARLAELDALIVVDQIEDEWCETVTPVVRDWLKLKTRGTTKTIFWADSRFHITDFRGAWIKPNQFEAVGQVPQGPEDQVNRDALAEALVRLRQNNGAPVTVTLGDKGLWISDPTPKHLPAFPVDGPIDTTGAGDSLTAGMVAALCTGASQEEAGWMGNLVASITIEQLGTTGTASPQKVLERFNKWQTACPEHFSDR